MSSSSLSSFCVAYAERKQQDGREQGAGSVSVVDAAIPEKKMRHNGRLPQICGEIFENGGRNGTSPGRSTGERHNPHTTLSHVLLSVQRIIHDTAVWIVCRGEFLNQSEKLSVSLLIYSHHRPTYIDVHPKEVPSKSMS